MSQTLISISEARRRVLEATGKLESEQVQVGAGLDRILARDVGAANDVPPFPCSAMDGYAVRHDAGNGVFTVIGESRAGAPFAGRLDDSQAVRISTGAAVPDGASAVIRQEDVVGDGNAIRTTTDLADGQNVRRRGEDMAAGTIVLRAGARLGPVELGAAVAAGVGSLTVARRPRAALLCTGDELRAPGEALGPGEIHNSNAPMLAALAQRCGAICDAEQRLPDDRAETVESLRAALERSDAVIVSGGVSVGPHDHVKPALAALGVKEVFWGVALQPGKPTWFGTWKERIVFGLPGNPVSAAVTFSLFARPALFALQGAVPAHEHPPQARLGVAVRRNPGREQALRVALEQRGLEVVAVPTGPQGSNMVSSLLGADALAMIPPGEGNLEEGTLVALEGLPH